MGNVTSDEDGSSRGTGDDTQSQPSDAFVQATRFKNELAEMQRALQTLHVSPSPALLPHQLALDDVVLACDPGVRVLVGPVIGKVDFQSARVLLEVSTRAQITCHVSAINALTNEVAELPQCRSVVSFEAQQPAVFRIERLAPGREYRISLSGIRREDAETRCGSFRTPTLETGESELRVIAVSGDDPAGLQAGERSVWKSVRERVEQKSADCVLHLGGQVAMKRIFDYASLLLLQHGSSLSRNGERAVGWQGMEAQAVEVLRGAYRTQWSLSSDVQFVLANVSNLMMWSDADMYPLFTTRKEFYIDHGQPTLQMQVIRTVTRCARRLYHEYQRQLWDDDMEAVFEREAEMLAVAESALESSGKIFKLSLQIPKVAQDLELQKQRREIEGARRVEKQLRALEAEKLKLEKQLVSYNQLLSPQRGEEFVYSVGAITVLFLDLRSARLEPGGAQAADNPLLSPPQWDVIERVLEQDGTRLLVICTELPVADEGLADRSEDTEGCKNNLTAWRNNSEAQARLLFSLFDWKLERPSREFILLSGSGQLGALSAKTMIKDTKLRTETIQYIVSSITAGSRVDGISIPLIGTASTTFTTPRVQATTVLHDRFNVEHVRVDADKKGFAVLSLKCGADTASPATQVEQADGSSNDDAALARVVLGPVVGWVDHHSATILLEIDRDADLACVIDNSFTGERRRFFQRFHAYRPNSFHLTRLRSEHFYQVRFSNIQRPGDFASSFTTLSLYPQKFEVVVMCNDASLLSANALAADSDSSNTTTLWQILADQTAGTPYSDIDLTLHLGGQFFPDSSAYVNEALLMADELYQDGQGSSVRLDEQLSTVTRISEKLRELYRLSWTAPAAREHLASGAHIFLINQNDLLPPSIASSPAGMLVQRQLRRVHHEYLDLLFPPIMRRDEAVPGVIAHHFGSLGAFVLPIRGYDDGGMDKSIRPEVWVDLDAFLTDEKMQVLLLVTTEPVVRDSPSDIMEQAKVYASYRSQFGFHQRDLDRLLGVLFRWQQPNQPPPGQIEYSSSPSSSRRVVLLSGDHCQSFDSVIQQFKSSAPVVPMEDAASSEVTSVQAMQSSGYDTSSIQQFVVGPLCAPAPNIFANEISPRPLVFLEGVFFSKYTYKHSRVLCQVDASISFDNTTAEPSMDSSEQVGDSSLATKSASKLSGQPPQCQFLRISLSLTGPNHINNPETAADSLEKHHWCTSQFVSRDPVEPRVQVDQKSRSNGQDSSVSVTYESINTSATCDDSLPSNLKMKLPKWLLELMLQPLTPEEQAQVDERAELLRGKTDAISTTFEQSSELVGGLLSFSFDSCGCIAELTHLFTEFYNRLGGPALREKFPAPPSPLAVRLVFYRLFTDPTDASPASGAIDKALFERLLTRCFLDGWMLSRRLTELFIETKETTAPARQEATANTTDNYQVEG